MNIISYTKSSNSNKIAFCIVDDIQTYQDDWTKQVITNIVDFTLSNLYRKGYDVFTGFNEDQLLKFVANDYKYALVFSPGTEFINGSKFFNALEKLCEQDFFLAGHILDRKDAYYELHHQCYLVNLEQYSKLGSPNIGSQELGVRHRQERPWRSVDNWHDDYTPVWVSGGDQLAEYNHKCHGWNILKIAFDEDLPVIVFDDSIRNNKKHHYPESKKDFEKNLSWIYYRNQFCATEHVHTGNTEWNNSDLGKFDQVIIPASGTLYLDCIDVGTVVFYDYNQQSLDYWEKSITRNANIDYKFVKADLLSENTLVNHINPFANRTLINISNIFCYEGTVALFPLSYRIMKENELINNLKSKIKGECLLNFSMRAATGFFEDLLLSGDLNSFNTTKELKIPTWHFNQEYIRSLANLI